MRHGKTCIALQLRTFGFKPYARHEEGIDVS